MSRFKQQVEFSPALKETIIKMYYHRRIVEAAVKKYLKAHNPANPGDVRDFVEMVPFDPNASTEKIAETTSAYLRDYYDMEHPELREKMLTTYFKTSLTTMADYDLSCLEQGYTGADRNNPNAPLTKSEQTSIFLRIKKPA